MCPAPSLLTTYSRPLEREFESWIVREIEDYFWTLGLRVFVWAVSPRQESTWPADEVMQVAGKLLGFQFKQAKAASGTLAYNRVKWTLGDPPGQYQLVQQHSEIYYALPTFLNRAWSRMSLAHCLFWRPQPGVTDYNAWYDNAIASTPHNRLARDATAFRWGQLIEDVMQCTAGRRIDGAFNLRSYVAALTSRTNEPGADSVRGFVEESPTSLLFLLYIPLT